MIYDDDGGDGGGGDEEMVPLKRVGCLQYIKLFFFFFLFFQKNFLNTDFKICRILNTHLISIAKYYIKKRDCFCFFSFHESSVLVGSIQNLFLPSCLCIWPKLLYLINIPFLQKWEWKSVTLGFFLKNSFTT